MKTLPEAGFWSRDGMYWRVCVWQVEFPTTIEADPVCAVPDREYSTHVSMSATKDKLENPDQRFHQSCARWRRSTLPFASSHSSRERTLARAKAIAQSAAP